MSRTKDTPSAECLAVGLTCNGHRRHQVLLPNTNGRPTTVIASNENAASPSTHSRFTFLFLLLAQGFKSVSRSLHLFIPLSRSSSLPLCRRSSPLSTQPSKASRACPTFDLACVLQRS